ncbi:hypothetical protein BJV74DRAFT_840899, partial [Russula compacta]
TEGTVAGVFKETERIEDPHDEEETDRQRWDRLMFYDGGVWRCTGCGGKPFANRCTLQRHCKSSVHGKKRDMRKCRFCGRLFRRLTSVDRHITKQHKEEMGSAGL